LSPPPKTAIYIGRIFFASQDFQPLGFFPAEVPMVGIPQQKKFQSGKAAELDIKIAKGIFSLRTEMDYGTRFLPRFPFRDHI